MPVETNSRKIVARLKREGWHHMGGGKHDKFEHPDRPGAVVVVPRYKTQTKGVAINIAKTAAWT